MLHELLVCIVPQLPAEEDINLDDVFLDEDESKKSEL